MRTGASLESSAIGPRHPAHVWGLYERGNRPCPPYLTDARYEAVRYYTRIRDDAGDKARPCPAVAGGGRAEWGGPTPTVVTVPAAAGSGEAGRGTRGDGSQRHRDTVAEAACRRIDLLRRPPSVRAVVPL
ncbi:hypothetical protein [Tomitella gaofuii]|uniref:hypothetical protein n=1 Tax=Tomitella gaofuii TaxID=2760083 RepID=UPI0015FE4AF4|nr:hypothetical protein [Tomitella gaofuii]